MFAMYFVSHISCILQPLWHYDDELHQTHLFGLAYLDTQSFHWVAASDLLHNLHGCVIMRQEMGPNIKIPYS